MKPSRRARPGLRLLLPLLLAAGCAPPGDRILRTADGEVITFTEMVEDLASVSLLLVGELHDSRSHHEAQLRVIRALHERGRPTAIGLEMFHEGHQEDLDRWVSGELAVEDFLPVYYHNWSAPWPLYRDIFLFAREKRIPMAALNASPDITSQVAALGFGSLSPRQVERIPGITCNVDAEYEEFIRKAYSGHEHGGQGFRNFCEAQMVWDSAMAIGALAFLDSAPGRVLVVLAGSGHSWKRGIPAQVRLRSGVPLRTVVPEVEDRLTREVVTAEDTDYLWLGL